MIFLPNDDALETQSVAIIEEVLKAKGLNVVGWRKVPVNTGVVGRMAKVTQPRFRQVLVEKAGLEGDALERALFVARKAIEAAARAKMSERASDLYFCTFSCRTIVYKGMLNSYVVGDFYTDLKNQDFESLFAIYHRRFSTNTVPKWPLAQPMRFLGHNGEINTLQGNLNWMSSRQVRT
jgi:glutamate synthase (ferredoxin)